MKHINQILIASVILALILTVQTAGVSAKGGDELKPDISAPGAVVNGWYTDDVTVTWLVPSEATVTKGCEETVLDYDTGGVELSCEAESEGVTLHGSVVLRRDTTPPKITINPPEAQIQVNEGDRLLLDATGSTDETSGVASINWDLDLNGVFEAQNPATFLAEDGGTVDVSSGDNFLPVRVMDQAGNVDEVGVVVIVLNVAPEINRIILSAEEIRVGDEVGLEVAYSDPGVLDTHTASIDWGDGVSESGFTWDAISTVTGAHTYAQPGAYTIEVTVTDKDGASDKAIASIVVKIPGVVGR